MLYVCFEILDTCISTSSSCIGLLVPRFGAYLISIEEVQGGDILTVRIVA